MPPHQGHKFLIETALAQVEELTVIVCEKKDDPISGALRAAWLQETHPAARVLLIDDYYDNDEDSQLWADLTIGWLGGVPDIAFTSEDYGDNWAKAMGCEHVKVDHARSNVPIGARYIRANPLANWRWLEPPLRAYYALRVVVLGAESSGSTTLSLDLAAHFNTVWVPEYGRDYCAQRAIFDNYDWQTGEFEAIAREQIRRENALAREANRVLLCDTNAFATRLWHWRYFGHYSPAVDAIAAEHRKPDLYLLTDVDIPFVQDGLRDGEAIRHAMHDEFVKELQQQDVPWVLISGSRDTRLQTAIEQVKTLGLE
ncbi:histidine kinase [bacterium]|nr:MAG: histidine kinase [bacterium]